jgi:hypothetical protein
MAIGNPINLTSNVEGKNISVIATAGQTQFTVTGGYRINQISVFRNGVRLVDGRDFTATDGATVTLLSAATVADVLEFQIFDDFRVSDALNVNSGGNVNGDVIVTGIVSTKNLSIGSSISLDATSGIVTSVQFVGDLTGTATTATNASGITGTPDITVNNIVAAAATFSGVLTYEDVTNIDSLGIVTARTGVDVTANGLVVNAGVSTFGADLSIADKIIHSGDTNTAIRFPSNDKFTVETAGVQRLEVDSNGDLGLVGIATATGLVVVAGSGGYAGHTGIITAVTFDGNLTGNVTGNISGGTVAGSTGTFTGDVDIADKIVHTGDTNTAIRFPAADTFTAETGGSEALRVDSSQRLLLGTTSSTTGSSSQFAKLQVIGNGSAAADRGAIVNLGHSAASSSITTGEQIGQILFTDNAAGEYGFIGCYADANAGSSDYPGRFVFSTTADGASSPTERLRIDSSGNVGIGTSSPGALLDVNGAAKFAGDVEVGDRTSTSGNFIWNYLNASGDNPQLVIRCKNSASDASSPFVLGTHSNPDAIQFHPNGSAAFASRVLIGTTTEGAAAADNLTIADSGHCGITIRSGATHDGAIYFSDATSGAAEYDGYIYYTQNGRNLIFGTAQTEAMRIDSSGNVGIGVTSPDSPLEVAGTNPSLVTVHHSDGGTGDEARIMLGALSGQQPDNRGAGIAAVNNGAGHDLTIKTSPSHSLSPTEKVRITSSGRLLVGSTSSRANGYGDNASLQLEGTSYPKAAISAILNSNNANGPSINFAKTRGTSNGSSTVVQSGDTLGVINFVGGDGTDITSPAAKIRVEVDGTPGSNDMPGRIVFDTTPNGSASPSERMRIDSQGRLLVGTTSTTIASALLTIQSSDPSFYIQKSSLPSSGNAIGAIRFADNSNNLGGMIEAEAEASWTSGSSHPTRLVFSTTASSASSPTENMRITEDRQILFGTTTTNGSGGITFKTNIVGSGTVASAVFSGDNRDNDVITFLRSGSTVGKIKVAGSATQYFTSSDYRLKENVVPVSDGITRLKQLKPSRFNFVVDPGKTIDGFLAHEVQSVIPDAVDGTKDEVDADDNPVYQGIDHSKLVPLLTAALQEAIAKIETLEAKVAALEAG